MNSVRARCANVTGTCPLPFWRRDAADIRLRRRRGGRTLSSIPAIHSGVVGGTMASFSTFPSPTVAGSARTISTPSLGPSGITSDLGSTIQGVLQDMNASPQGTQALQMMLMLIIFMALLQAGQQGGSGSAADAAGLLESLNHNGTASQGADALSMQQASLSISSTTIVASFDQVAASTQTCGGLLDFQA